MDVDYFDAFDMYTASQANAATASSPLLAVSYVDECVTVGMSGVRQQLVLWVLGDILFNTLDVRPLPA